MNDQLKPGSFTAPHIVDSAHTGNDLPGPGRSWPPLGLLRDLDRDCPALLLLSIANTHRHAFDYEGFTVERHSTPQAVIGEFRQRATGRRYTVGVLQQLPAPAADPRDALRVPAAWIDLFAEALDCLRQAEPYVAAVSVRDPELARLATRIRYLTQECPDS